jgi:hypothetical protein
VEGSMFFFEKKNQKTFVFLVRYLPGEQTGKSLFASFSSEKEDLSFFTSCPPR